MSEKQISARTQQKIDLTANWEKATNFIPKKGEIIVYSDGGGTGVPKMKVGDGTTVVGSLKFIESDGKLSTGRKISLGTAVSSTATEFDGSKDITIPVNSVSASYLSWGGRNLVNGVSPIDAALSYMHSANRLQFAKPAGITIEYSTNSGSTWTDYDATNNQKISLVSGLNAGLSLGKRTSGTTATTDALRITLNATNCGVYTLGRTLLIEFQTGGATGCQVKVETSTKGAPTTFTDRGSYNIDGQSGWNSYPINIGAFGGNSSQTSQNAAIRLTFTTGSAAVSGQIAKVFNILLFGDATWSTPSNMARTGHMYSWDVNQNVTFPAGITATSFSGNATSASKVSNSLIINGTSYDGSAAVSLTSQQLGVPSAFIHKSVSTLDCNNEKIGRVLSSSSSNNITNGPSDIGQDGACILWNIPHMSPLQSINESGAWQYMYQVFASLSGQVYLRKNSSNGTATWTYGEWAKVLTDKNFVLPIASSSTLGGVKIGSGLTVAEDGTISAAAEYTLPTASSTIKGGIKVGSGLTMSSETLNHSNSITAKTAYGSTATTASANGGKIVVTDIKYDAQGHITGSTDRTITLSQATYTLAGLMGSTAKGSATQPVYWNGTAWTNTTYTLGKSVPADAKFTDTVYSLPTASSTLGGVKTTSTVSATTGLTACPIIDGVVYYKDTNNTYTLAGLVGSTAIGSVTNPIYWDGSKFAKTTYTLGKSVPSDAKFTDTVYSLPAATTTTLGGIIAGSGLSITTEGKLSVSKVPNALSINGKSFDGSAAIDVGVIGAAYGGSGKTSLSASANAFLNSLPYGSTSEATLTDDHSFYMNGLTGQTNYKVPMSSVYTYVKGKLDSVYQPVGSYLTAIPKATTSVLGGIKLGTGLTAASDGTVNVSVGGATITLKTWTDADVA